MSRFASFFLVAVLLFFVSVTFAARPEPAFHDATTLPTTQSHVEEVEIKEGSCEGVAGQELEECLRRSTLAAHIDYIYTQSHNRQP
ncbi:OLC1v1011418C1 [Oldenlandia corymbosa var. corymbosa]|uniref:Phytosulfokine n=1 Tax=Oldenlandia corymbosa var. corymbosa TaxID=529605 RepID=A0AAV1DVY0_OLDCO|nr:OLC1v1011418C1 [Oldenlandia corymbosa var. corymbosa]